MQYISKQKLKRKKTNLPKVGETQSEKKRDERFWSQFFTAVFIMSSRTLDESCLFTLLIENINYKYVNCIQLNN